MKALWTYSRLRLLRRDERGTVVTEFVVSMPIILVFLFGLIGMGQLLWYHQIITNGVRDGTRYLSRVQSPMDDAQVKHARNLAMKGIIGDGGFVFYFWTDKDSILVEQENIANPDGAFRASGPVPVVRMTATVKVSLPVLGYLLLGPTLTAEYTVSDEARWIGR